MATIDLKFVQGLTLEEKASLVSGKDFWFTAKVPGVAASMMTDGPSGLRKQADGADALGLNDSVAAIAFPSSALTASSFDDHLLFELGQHLGVAAKAENIGILLGPGVNIKRSPLAGRNFEYFSEDPLLSGRMGVNYVKGVQSQGVGVSVKHFAANNRENQRFTSSSNIDERTLREIYLSQFERIVKEAQPATIMASYNKINGELVSQNQRLLTQILRDEWGFEGFVMSDWGAVADHVAALKAGLELEMPGKGPESVNEIVTAVKDGRLQESVLDRAVLRILTIITKWGRPVDAPTTDYDQDEQHTFARQLATESIVLLKNDAAQLPLKSDEQIAVIGELAARPRYQGGGSSHVNAYHLVTPVDAMPTTATYAQGYVLNDDTDDERLSQEALQLAQTSSHVVIFVGYPEDWETEGFDKDKITLPANQNNLIEKIATVNANVTVVLQNGSAVEMPWVDDVAAIVETYLAGEAVGEATWDILTGQVNPSGKLSESFPLRVVDNPTALTFGRDLQNETYHEGIFVGYRYYDAKDLAVLFPFGHGLSYTTFDYHDLTITEDADQVSLTFTITNTGKVAGKEVAQIYVGNQTSKVEMPIKELRDFVKVDLNPGESKQIKTSLSRRDFAWYDSATASWRTDNGQYEFFIGSSSRDILLQAAFELTIGSESTAPISGNTYISEIWETGDSKIEQALEDSGLKEKIKPILGSGNDAIFANIPLRALGMVNIPSDTINKFLKIVNQ